MCNSILRYSIYAPAGENRDSGEAGKKPVLGEDAKPKIACDRLIMINERLCR